MSVTNLFDPIIGDPYADHEDAVADKRAELLSHLTYAIRVLQHSCDLVTELRGKETDDAELIEGRDGRDVAAHLDASVRTARAAFAVLHCVFEKERP